MIGLFQRSGLSSLLSISQDCVLCDAPDSEIVCQPCQRGLPKSLHACPICAAPNHTQICGVCISEQPHFDATVAAFNYRYPLDRLVQSFKFSANLTLVDFFADALAAEISHQAKPPPDYIIALPLANKRLATRGFNQSALLADALSNRLSCKVAHHAMRRIRETPPQTGLSKVLRLKNIKGAFDCVGDYGGQHIAIVDDVMTTGATLSEAAKVIKQAGAASVSAWIIARAVTEIGEIT
jgi:ComF family protein